MTKKERRLKKAFKAMLRGNEVAVLAKLMHNERKYRFGWAWRGKDWEPWLWHDLPNHVLKGDPRDVNIYSHFAMFHGWRTAPPEQPYINHRGEPRFIDPNLNQTP